MDIYEFAIEKEKLAKQTYAELADKCDHPGLSKILSMLADEEDVHARTIEQMRDEKQGQVSQSRVLNDAKDVFEKMHKAKEKFNFQLNAKELFEKARKIEEESMNYYVQKSQESENPEHKRVFKDLAGEEQKHYKLMESFCEFISRPEQWLENAEFTHLESY